MAELNLEEREADNAYDLMPSWLQAKMPGIRSQEDVDDPLCQVKYFHPLSYWTWYGIEYGPTERIFFGFVAGDYPELGYFSLEELKSVRVGGLGIERDLYFKPQLLSEIEKVHEAGGVG